MAILIFLLLFKIGFGFAEDTQWRMHVYCSEKEVEFRCNPFEVLMFEEAWYGRSPRWSNNSCVGNYKPHCEEDVTLPLNSLCSGFDSCVINPQDDVMGERCYGANILYVKYTCIPESEVKKFCGFTLSGINGHITNPGYPGYYPGPLECQWMIRVERGKKIRLTFADFWIRSVNSSNQCRDYVQIFDNNRPIFRGCGAHKGFLETQSNIVEIKFISKEFWPKRGFWISYQAINCRTPIIPFSHVVQRTITAASFSCNPGYTFRKDSSDVILLNCIKNERWDRFIPQCITIKEMQELGYEDEELGVVFNETQVGNMTAVASLNRSGQDIVTPSIIIGVMLLINAIILIVLVNVRKRQERKLRAASIDQDPALTKSLKEANANDLEPGPSVQSAVESNV